MPAVGFVNRSAASRTDSCSTMCGTTRCTTAASAGLPAPTRSSSVSMPAACISSASTQCMASVSRSALNGNALAAVEQRVAGGGAVVCGGPATGSSGWPSAACCSSKNESMHAISSSGLVSVRCDRMLAKRRVALGDSWLRWKRKAHRLRTAKTAATRPASSLYTRQARNPFPG